MPMVAAFINVARAVTAKLLRTASSIMGSRRPSRDRTPSEIEPISGSRAASSVMLIASAAPTRLPERPSTAV